MIKASQAKKCRVPQKHVNTIRWVSQGLGPVPRYALGKAVAERLQDVSFSTVMDYVYAAVDEGILEKVGMNYQVKLVV